MSLRDMTIAQLRDQIEQLTIQKNTAEQRVAELELITNRMGLDLVAAKEEATSYRAHFEVAEAERNEARLILAKWDKDYEGVCEERDEALARAYDAEADRAQRMVECDLEVDRLRALLREVELATHGCLFCGRNVIPDGHTPDCRLAAALGERDGVQL